MFLVSARRRGQLGVLLVQGIGSGEAPQRLHLKPPPAVLEGQGLCSPQQDPELFW